MRKISVLAFTLFVVCAFSAVTAQAALAVEVPQWLDNGVTIELGFEIVANLEGTLLYEDMNAVGKPNVLCEIREGVTLLFSNGEGTITKAVCPAPTVDSGTCERPVVEAERLPWTTLVLEPVANSYELDITAGTGGEPAWLVECTILGVRANDTCSTTKSKALLTSNAEGFVAAEFMEEVEKSEQYNCTVGGAEQGLVVGTLVIHSLNAGGELIPLSVSLTEEVP